jgi:hypothetical protein
MELRSFYKKFIYRNISKIDLLIISFIFLFSLFGSFSINSDNLDFTTVKVNPKSLVIPFSESFTIDVYCEQNDPIKSFELKILFNPLYLEAISVAEGDIFNGFVTFFNPGVIDNIAGVIDGVFCSIMGQGNVTNPGSFVSISFNAKSNEGSSYIELYNVGVTNESEYLSIDINNGIVIVHPGGNKAIISNPNPINGSINLPIKHSSISVNIEIPNGDYFNWFIVTNPDVGSSVEYNTVNGSKSCSISGLKYNTRYHWYVSCISINSGNWTNKSYWFKTVASDSISGEGSNSYIPLNDNSFDNNSNENHPPEKPIKPNGSKIIKQNDLYEFITSTFDVDEDEIRYRYDWGDNNLSDWSDFKSSNESISMFHFWKDVSNFSVKVIAQDKHGANSSWSSFHNITVIKNELLEQTPVVDIISNVSVNETVIFNASSRNGSESDIVNYSWDLGDNKSGYGINLEHIYRNPGTYNVTLELTDINGNKYSKKIVVNVGLETEDKKQIKQESSFFYWLIFDVFIFILIVFIVINNKNKLKILFKLIILNYISQIFKFFKKGINIAKIALPSGYILCKNNKFKKTSDKTNITIYKDSHRERYEKNNDNEIDLSSNISDKEFIIDSRNKNMNDIISTFDKYQFYDKYNISSDISDIEKKIDGVIEKSREKYSIENVIDRFLDELEK